MSFGKRIKIIAVLVVIFLQVGGTYAEPAMLASGLADYLQHHKVANAAAIRPLISTYVAEQAHRKAVFLALPWSVALVLLLRSESRANPRAQPKGQA